MSDHASDGPTESPAQWCRRVVRQAWRDALSVYYANTPVWRWLKSGALLFLGLFLWSGSNLLLSYQPDWWFLTYPLAYGFVLVVWGPLTHMAVVPTVIRLRREATTPALRWFARHGSKVNLSVFLAIVIVLGTYPVGPMTLDFAGAIGTDGADVDPELECTADEDVLHCHVSEHEGYDSVVVRSGGDEIARSETAPHSFDVPFEDMAEGPNGKRIEIELRDADGNTVRRYVRTFPGR